MPLLILLLLCCIVIDTHCCYIDSFNNNILKLNGVSKYETAWAIYYVLSFGDDNSDHQLNVKSNFVGVERKSI